jgi:2-polyprenyl-3-methyl-5-hydroxy-6-metoxy-1,4-benzoquinol methylase
VVEASAATWRAHRRRASLEANLRRAGIREEAFWERYGAWVAAMQGDYPGVLLDRVMTYARPGGTVLDIGAGTGLFAVPLARTAHSVTAVEPSPAQARQLHEAIRREGAGNVTVVEKRWEDVDVEELGSHDLVLAIHSLQMDDIAAALRKMCRIADHCLLLVHTAGNSLSAVFRDLFGIEPCPDYTGLCEMLTGLGYRPEVEFVDYSYDVPLETQMDIFRYNPGLDAGQCQALRDYVISHGMTTQRDGDAWLRRSYTDALISVTCD